MVFKDYKTRVPGQGAEAQGEEGEPYPPQKTVKPGRWPEGPEGGCLASPARGGGSRQRTGGVVSQAQHPPAPLQGGLSFPLDANWYDCLVEALTGNVRQARLMKNTRRTHILLHSTHPTLAPS